MFSFPCIACLSILVCMWVQPWINLAILILYVSSFTAQSLPLSKMYRTHYHYVDNTIKRFLAKTSVTLHYELDLQKDGEARPCLRFWQNGRSLFSRHLSISSVIVVPRLSRYYRTITEYTPKERYFIYEYRRSAMSDLMLKRFPSFPTSELSNFAVS